MTPAAVARPWSPPPSPGLPGPRRIVVGHHQQLAGDAEAERRRRVAGLEAEQQQRAASALHSASSPCGVLVLVVLVVFGGGGGGGGRGLQREHSRWMVPLEQPLAPPAQHLCARHRREATAESRASGHRWRQCCRGGASRACSTTSTTAAVPGTEGAAHAETRWSCATTASWTASCSNTPSSKRPQYQQPQYQRYQRQQRPQQAFQAGEAYEVAMASGHWLHLSNRGGGGRRVRLAQPSRRAVMGPRLPTVPASAADEARHRRPTPAGCRSCLRRARTPLPPRAMP